jgi:ATP-dependent exoDNAse (exonuclease V) beta subunit
MTIHAAKGLEFPAVVVPFHHWRFDLSGRLGAVDLDGDALLAFLDKDMGPAWDQAMAASLQEDLDLLYVAWTRAREELHGLVTRSDYYDRRSPLLAALDAMLGKDPWTGERFGVPVLEAGQAPAPSPAGPLQAPAGRALDAASSPAHSRSAAAGSGDKPISPLSAPAAPLPALPPAGRPMAWLPRLKIHRHFSRDVSREELFARPGFDELARGTIFHEALANLAGGRLAPEAAARAALALHAPSLPPDPEERERLLAQVREALAWVLAQPDLAEAIAVGLAEQSILDAEGALHRADLVALFPGRTVVLEYKTGGGDPAYPEQVRRYLGLLAGADPDRPARGYLVFLDRQTVEEVA